MSLLSAYQDLITSQHRGKPRYMATVTALLKYSTDIYSCAVYLDDNYEDFKDDIMGSEFNARLAEYKSGMKFELNDYGKSINILEIE